MGIEMNVAQAIAFMCAMASPILIAGGIGIAKLRS
jgi:hypothetical protein